MLNRSQKIFFSNFQGHRLEGRLDLPASRKPKAYGIYAHCFTCTKEIHIAHRLGMLLAAQDIAVLRFDFTGLGGSEGDFASSNFTTNVEDIKAAALFLRQNYQPAQLMIGHSLGGTAALVATQHLKEIQGIVTLNSPYHPAHVMHHFEAEKAEILTTGISDISIDGRIFQIKKQFLEDVENYNMTEILSDLNAALLIMHTPEDRIVNIQNAGSLFAAARHPKSFISLDQADHLISRGEDAQYIASLIYHWALKYLK